MAPPRKRVRVVISDDDEDQPEDQPLKAQDSTSKATARRSARLSSKPPQSQPSVPVDGDEYIEPPSTARPAPSKGRLAAPKPTRKAASIQKSPSKSGPKTSPSKAQRPNASIKSFFGASQSGQISFSQLSEPRVTKRPTKKATSSSSGLNRLVLSQGSSAPFLAEQIEDSSEEDVKPKLQGAGSSFNSVLSQSREVNGNPDDDGAPTSLPWPEKYAPHTVDTLAVNKTKVAQVRSWLQQVLYGQSSKRLLVLKGPAGAGKTATVECLSNELSFDLLEWRNPSSNESGHDGTSFSSFSGLFEDFLARAGKWNTLDIVTTSKDGSEISPEKDEPLDSDTKKVILIEDFPNMLVSSSSPLLAFQHSVKSFLALQPEDNPSPIVMIITETPNFTGNSALTAHRLLGPAILHHPRSTEIEFRPIAKKFMTKALEDVLHRENKENKRLWGPGKAILEKIGGTGDIRSALAGLEFLCISGEEDAWKGEVRLGAKGKKKQSAENISERHLKLLQAIPSRETHLNIFHAVGKVVYNKRFGDDPSDPYKPPPPRPVLPHHPYHKRAQKSTPESIHEELTTDMSLFVSALHENYILSCRSSDEINGCIDALSDAELLLPSNLYEDGGYRREEIAFDVAVRGLLLSLPSPVQRKSTDHGLTYPLSARLWKKTEENEGLMSAIAQGLRNEEVVPPAYLPSDTALSMELIPYSNRILSRKFAEARMSSSGTRISMRKFLQLGNLPKSSEDPDSEAEGEEVADNWKGAQKGVASSRSRSQTNALSASVGAGTDDLQAGGELSDDEINDFSD